MQCYSVENLQKFNENSKLFLASYFYRFNESEITEETVNPYLLKPGVVTLIEPVSLIVSLLTVRVKYMCCIKIELISAMTEETVNPVLENMLRLFAILELVDSGYSTLFRLLHNYL